MSAKKQGGVQSSAASKPFDVNQNVRYYHDKYARCGGDTKKIDIAKQVVQYITKKLKTGDAISRIEYVGSHYELTRLKESSDFDYLLVQREKKQNDITVKKGSGIPGGYAELRRNSQVLSPKTEKERFISLIQKVINDSSQEFCTYDLIMRYHGPAIQVDVKNQEISIDLVPAIEKTDGSMHVAKAPRSSVTTELWRISHSLEAKDKLTKADSGNGCRREVYRVLKHVRNTEANMHHMTSYMIKCALFRVMDRFGPGYWNRKQIGDRTLNVMEQLRDAYDKKHLSDYYEKHINLLEGVNPITCVDTRNRLTRILDKPERKFVI